VTPAEVTGGDGAAFRSRHAITGPIVLQVGAMARDKGTIATVHAMQQLWATGSAATLVLIGAPLAHFQEFYDQLPATTTAHIRILAYASDAERREVLRSEADARGLFLSDEVMSYMLSRFSRDLSSLMILLDHLDQFALETKRAMTIPLIKSMLEST
jgi:hypothetical protein